MPAFSRFLRYFVAVGRLGSIRKAADELNVSASAIDRQILNVEADLGMPLFERLPSGMALTPAGELLLHHARQTLLNVEKIAVELGEFAQGVRGHVRMLANLSAIVEFLPEDLPGFFSTHDQLRFDLQERPSAGVVRGIDEGAADIGICSADVETRGLDTFPYRRDRLVVVAPADHPLTRRGPVHFADTLDYDHIGLHAASSIYLRSQYTAQQVGKSIRLRIHVPGFDAVCRMVHAGMGIGLIPDRAFEVLSDGMNLQAVPLLDDWADRELRIVVRDVGRLSITGRLMFDHLTGAAANRRPPVARAC